MAKFICIEGISYTGKTTLFENLGNHGFYKANRIAMGYDQLYRQAKNSYDFKTKHDFFKNELAARSNDYQQIESKFVADRYFMSIISHYNIYLGKDLFTSDTLFYNSLKQPDLTLLLTANTDSIRLRDKKRNVVNYELLETIQNEFLKIVGNFQNIEIIKTDNLNIKQVLDITLELIENGVKQ